ncbi:MAG: metal-dependent hydrolase [Polyangiaceae bacterium]
MAPAVRPAAAESTILPRSLPKSVDRDVPRYWFADNAIATQISNGVNILFPAGERFFVRSVKHYLDRIDDPKLRADVKGFFGQEGRHAKEHDLVAEILEAQGYDLSGFFRVYEKLAFGVLEKRVPPSLRLAATAAAEHFTAILAEDALRMNALDLCDPSMRALLLWHAAEEIEHRAVAFDVLQTVAPDYTTRIAGLAIATTCLGGFWFLGAATLLVQDGKRDFPRLVRDLKRLREVPRRDRSVFLRGIREYFRRDFHPKDKDTDALAIAYLRSQGMAA